MVVLLIFNAAVLFVIVVTNMLKHIPQPPPRIEASDPDVKRMLEEMEL